MLSIYMVASELKALFAFAFIRKYSPHFQDYGLSPGRVQNV